MDGFDAIGSQDQAEVENVFRVKNEGDIWVRVVLDVKHVPEETMLAHCHLVTVKEVWRP